MPINASLAAAIGYAIVFVRRLGVELRPLDLRIIGQ